MIANFQYITGKGSGETLLRRIRNYCRAGGQWVQLRMKEASFKEILEVAVQAKAITAQFNAKLIINDYPEIARSVNAFGVHLGKNDVSASEAKSLLFDYQIIGSTCNSWTDILHIHKEGKSDYIGLGPFRFTKTKEKLSPVLGVEGLKELKDKMQLNGIDLPTIAVGGITKNDLEALYQTGISGVAASALIEQEENIQGLLNQVDRFTQEELDYAKFEISG